MVQTEPGIGAVLAAIAGRRTPSKFSAAPVPRDLIEQIIGAACWAPNHRLTEPWRFAVVEGAARAALAGAMVAELAARGGDAVRVEKEATGIRTKLVRSPVIIVVGQDRQGGAVNGERDLEDYAACACATQNLLLAAHAVGLAGKWSTGGAVDSAAAKAFLGFAPEDRIVGYIYLGYADGEAPSARRRPPAEVTRWLGS